MRANDIAVVKARKEITFHSVVSCFCDTAGVDRFERMCLPSAAARRCARLLLLRLDKIVAVATPEIHGHVRKLSEGGYFGDRIHQSVAHCRGVTNEEAAPLAAPLSSESV
jgi:hypothetical protein